MGELVMDGKGKRLRTINLRDPVDVNPRIFDEKTGHKPGVNDGDWGNHISMSSFALVYFTNLCNYIQSRCFTPLVSRKYNFALKKGR